MRCANADSRGFLTINKIRENPLNPQHPRSIGSNYAYRF